MKARTFKDYILTRSKNRGHLRGQITLPLTFFSLRHAPLAVHHDCIKKWRYGRSVRKIYNFTGAANKGRGVGEGELPKDADVGATHAFMGGGGATRGTPNITVTIPTSVESVIPESKIPRWVLVHRGIHQPTNFKVLWSLLK